MKGCLFLLQVLSQLKSSSQAMRTLSDSVSVLHPFCSDLVFLLPQHFVFLPILSGGNRARAEWSLGNNGHGDERDRDRGSEGESGMKRPERKAEEQSLMIRDGIVTIVAKKIACSWICNNIHKHKHDALAGELAPSRTLNALISLHCLLQFSLSIS